jgi:predicted ATP-binding protein involved in virulence
LFDWFIWQRDLEQLSNGLIWATVSKALLQMLNNTDDEEKVFKRLYIDPSVFNNYQLMLEKGTEHVNVLQLSSGEKSLFVLVGDLARRLALANPLSKNPLEHGQGIVLIDEIDLHLHSRWQYQIVPKLLKIFPNIQFVISTHSMLVVSNISKEQGQIYFLQDSKIKEAVGIYGKDLNHLVDSMGVPSRNLDVQNELSKCRQLIEDEKLDEAKCLLAHLETILANEDDANPDPEILYLKSFI